GNDGCLMPCFDPCDLQRKICRDEACILSGAKMVKGAGAQDRQLVAEGILQRQQIFCNFADAVWCRRAQRRIFVDWQFVWRYRAIDLRRTDDENARGDFEPQAARYQVEQRTGVNLDGFPWRFK